MPEEPSLDSDEAEQPEFQDRADVGHIPQRVETFFSPHDLAFRRHRGGFMIISVFALFFSFLLFFTDLFVLSALAIPSSASESGIVSDCLHGWGSCSLLAISPLVTGLVLMMLLVFVYLISSSVSASFSWSRLSPHSLKSERQVLVFFVSLFLIILLIGLFFWRMNFGQIDYFFIRSIFDFCQIVCLFGLCVSSGILTFSCETTPGIKLTKVFKLKCVDYYEEGGSSHVSEFAKTEWATVRKIIFAGNVAMSGLTLVLSIVCLSLIDWEWHWEYYPAAMGFLTTLWIPAPLQLFLSIHACVRLWNSPVNPTLTETKRIRLLHFIFYPIIVLVVVLVSFSMAINPRFGEEFNPFRLIVGMWYVPAIIMAFGSLFQLQLFHWEYNGFVPALDLFAIHSDEFLRIDSILQSRERIRKILLWLFGICSVVPVVIIVLAAIDDDPELVYDDGPVNLIVPAALQMAFSIAALLVTIYRINAITFGVLTLAAVPVFVYNVVGVTFGAISSEFGRIHYEIIVILVLSPLLDVMLVIQWSMMIFFLVTMKYANTPDISTIAYDTI